MSELQPIVPRDETTGTGITVPAHDTPEPVPITEQEVGEYREQDRFLPVSYLSMTLLLEVYISFGFPFVVCVDRKRGTDNEICSPPNSQNCERRKGMRSRMRVRIHFLHHFRSRRKMSA